MELELELQLLLQLQLQPQLQLQMQLQPQPPTADLVGVMEEAGDRGVVEHVCHVLVQQLLAPRVAGVELHGVVPQLLQG